MVQTLTANRTKDPLDVGTLPRRSWLSQHFLNAKLFHLLGEISTENAVPVTQ
jgi:hypothetical protein